MPEWSKSNSFTFEGKKTVQETWDLLLPIGLSVNCLTLNLINHTNELKKKPTEKPSPECL